jgi:predicted DNA-binding protein (MmcQ/YjbR family)
MGTVARVWATLRDSALALPEAWEDHPWGETVVKVRKKIFVFLGTEGSDPLSMSVKLTESHGHAMTIPGAEPTGYGMGKAGWVTLRPGAAVDPELLCEWIGESYRNVAPKTLVRELDAP